MNSSIRQPSTTSITSTNSSTLSTHSNLSTTPTIPNSTTISTERYSCSYTDDAKLSLLYFKESVKAKTFSNLGSLHARILGFK